MVNSLTIQNVHAGYGAVRVIEDVSMDVDSGKTVVLLGTNGNGKSTLIKCIMGLCRPSEGSITAEIDGVKHELVGKSVEEIVDLGIALVPEGRRLFPRLTVEENLLLGAFRQKARAQMKPNLEFCFETFPRLAERKSQLAGSMSGGEQQMLALARALMLAPKILLIDEPSVGLSPLLVSRTIDTIQELKSKYQLTVLMAEQNFNQAIRIADSGYVIVHGKIAFSGKSARRTPQQRSDPEAVSRDLSSRVIRTRESGDPEPGSIPDYGPAAFAAADDAREMDGAYYFVASPPSTMMVSTSPAPLRRNAAASSYSFEVKQATPCSKVGNSITTKRWNLSGPSMI